MSLPTIDHETLSKIAEGDESVLTQVYQAHREEFLVWAQKNFRCSEEVAKDSYQVAFFIFYDNISTGKVTHLTSSIKTYLFGIGKHKLFEQNRKEVRYCQEIKEELLGYDQPENPYLEQEEKFQQLEKGLEQLGSPCREIIEMKYYEKRSVEYIADKLGYKNIASAKNQKYKCMQRLKKLLGANTLHKTTK
ncbi:MAG: sigma-70 family RNA polymerase sigma factor [Bacteroidota bacterium]